MRVKKRSAAAVAIGAVLVGVLGAVAQSAAQDGSIAVCIVTSSDGTTEAFPCDEDGNRIGEPSSGTTVTTAPAPATTQATTTVAPEQATTTAAEQVTTTTVASEDSTTSVPAEGSEDDDSGDTPPEDSPVAEAVSGEPDYTG